MLKKSTETKNSNEIKFVTAISDRNLYLGSLRYLQDAQIYLQNASINENKMNRA